jgi:hypothetical protein
MTEQVINVRQEQEATAIADDPGKGDPVAQKMRPVAG